jgi:hypothetical protein
MEIQYDWLYFHPRFGAMLPAEVAFFAEETIELRWIITDNIHVFRSSRENHGV